MTWKTFKIKVFPFRWNQDVSKGLTFTLTWMVSCSGLFRFTSVWSRGAVGAFELPKQQGFRCSTLCHQFFVTTVSKQPLTKQLTFTHFCPLIIGSYHGLSDWFLSLRHWDLRTFVKFGSFCPYLFLFNKDIFIKMFCFLFEISLCYSS